MLQKSVVQSASPTDRQSCMFSRPAVFPSLHFKQAMNSIVLSVESWKLNKLDENLYERLKNIERKIDLAW